MKTKKDVLIAGIFLLTFSLYSTTDIYVSFSPDLVRSLQASEKLFQLSFLIGPLVAMTLSRLLGVWLAQFSYRVLYILTVLTFCLGSGLSSRSLKFGYFDHFIAGRVIQAVALTALALLNSSLLASTCNPDPCDSGDSRPMTSLERVLQTYSGIFSLTFLIAPLLGSFIQAQFGAQWCFFFPILLSLFSLGIILSALPKRIVVESKSTASEKSAARYFYKWSILDRHLLGAALPPSVSFVFSVHAPFYLAQLDVFSTATPSATSWVSLIQVLPLLCQLLASSFKRNLGYWPLVGGAFLLLAATLSPSFLKAVFVVSAFCVFPFFLVPWMARSSALYFQTRSKWEASANLNFSRNLFIFVLMSVYTFAN